MHHQAPPTILRADADVAPAPLILPRIDIKAAVKVRFRKPTVDDVCQLLDWLAGILAVASIAHDYASYTGAVGEEPISAGLLGYRAVWSVSALTAYGLLRLPDAKRPDVPSWVFPVWLNVWAWKNQHRAKIADDATPELVQRIVLGVIAGVAVTAVFPFVAASFGRWMDPWVMIVLICFMPDPPDTAGS